MADKRVGMMCRVEPGFRENVRRVVAEEAGRRGDPDYTVQAFMVEAITHWSAELMMRPSPGSARIKGPSGAPANCANHANQEGA